jgi:glycerol-3-phosphate dehydrogenase (NAD(P)+)
VTAVAVLGAGSWGTTLADLLARNGHEVRLWAYEAEVVHGINERRENPLFLPGQALAEGLTACAEPADAVRGAEQVVAVAPSHVTRGVLARAAPHIRDGTVVTCATKGIEGSTLQLMSQVAREVLPPHRFVALSGPSFALELFARQPTAVVAASVHPDAAALAQRLFTNGYFRIYTSGDVIGTELCGSLKNVIAIAVGILEGMGLGNNPRAALITRGLAEMTRLGTALGADPRTFAGLAGMGDLILTTCGSLSRNRALGVALAGGVTLAAYRQQHRTVAEGANTAEAAVRLAERAGVELPIIEQVWQILFRAKPPRQAISDLMDRTPKPEL